MRELRKRPALGSCGLHLSVPAVSTPVDLPAEVYNTLDSVILWGEHSVAVNLLLWTIARRANPRALWVTLCPPEELPPHDPVALGWVHPDRVRFLRPEQFAPSRGVETPTLVRVVRPDEPQENVTLLTDFLGLPQTLQELVPALAVEGGHPVLVVEFSERISRYYPSDHASSSALMRVIRSEGVKLLSSFIGQGRPDRFAFDHVYRVQSPTREEWRSSTVTREQGSPGPPFEMGVAIPLQRLARFRDTIEQLK